ncbi:MAG: hypothetical protein Q9227_006309 [Pyrenula ochraceoflavens]
MSPPAFHIGPIDEHSPLLSPSESPSVDDEEQPRPLSGGLQYEEQGHHMPQSKSSLYLLLLTLSIGGLQIVWSVELSHGSPYLLSLGMSKSLLAFVWIAGPLSGSLVQPYVGIRSDNCRISWGKRKPFMIGGGAATIIGLLALAWTRELVGGIGRIFGSGSESANVKIGSIVFATVFMYMLDFAINTAAYQKYYLSLKQTAVQAGIRAFIVDNAPAHQQESANAWASRVTGVGNVLGYVFGYINLPRYFPFFGDTQFKVLCVIASFSLGITLAISCSFIQERDPRLEGPPTHATEGFLHFFAEVFKSIKRLPPQIRKVCEVQFFNWIGWFPFLFYITTYIGQLYLDPIFSDHPDLSNGEINDLWEDATRVGTLALLIFAITSFVSNIILPFLIVPTYEPTELEHGTSASRRAILPRSASTAGMPYSSSTADLTLITSAELSYPSTPDTESRVQRFITRLQIPGLTLRRTWLISQIFFALCMLSTFFISKPLAATVMTTLVGISWSVSLWAPFALISAEVARRDEERRQARKRKQRGESVASSSQQSRSTSPTPQRNNNALSKQTQHSPEMPSLDSDSIPPDSHPAAKSSEAEEEDHHDQAGIILGLHNVAVSSPQILATLISSAVFRSLQKPRGTAGDASLGWVLRIGGLAALLAAWRTMRLEEKASIRGGYKSMAGAGERH